MKQIFSNLKNLKKWQLAILSSVLMSIGWPPLPLFFVLMIGLVPLLIMEEKIEVAKNNKFQFFGYIYLSLLIWNILTTWWVYKASLGGAIFMLFANSLLQTTPWLLYRYTKKIVSQDRALLLFICYYLGFEYIHHVWDLSWPWLTLGNSLASANIFAQWYEFTGTAGGSLWILLINVLIFNALKKQTNFNTSIAIIVLPILLSITLFFIRNSDKSNPIHVGISQPNFEPHEEKFSINSLVQLDTMLAQMDQLYQKGARIMVLPETALVDHITEVYCYQNEKVIKLQKFIKDHPGTSVLAGCETLVEYDKKATPTAREFSSDPGFFYDSYNTAYFLDSLGLQPFYHKAKLVPGTEIMPYPGLLSYLGKYAIALGGTSGSLGRDFKIVTFKIAPNQIIAPNICYESIFGEWTGKFISQNNAGMIAVISNDGWWGQTYGHKQLMQYGTLRAIETRKWILRSGNTGISAIINEKGQVVQSTKFWERNTLNGTAFFNYTKTIYTLLGDYIGKIALLIALFVLPGLLVKKFTKNKEQKNAR